MLLASFSSSVLSLLTGEEEDNHQSTIYSVLSAKMGVNTCGHRVEWGLEVGKPGVGRLARRLLFSLLVIRCAMNYSFISCPSAPFYPTPLLIHSFIGSFENCRNPFMCQVLC